MKNKNPLDFSRKRIVNSTLMLVVAIFFMACMCSCSKNEKIRENFFRGMYDMANQFQEMKSTESAQLGQEVPTYDQYKKKRQKMLNDQELMQTQPQDKDIL